MGALKGYRVIELAGIGPAPMTGMMLADMGAEVIRIERSAATNPMLKLDVSMRGKKSVVLDLKQARGVEVLLDLLRTSDVLIDPYRPGVCEKLGIGPEVCLAANPRLVFARMTGWGQDGPLAQAAGHDINYISLTGALYATGLRDKPIPPLNLVGDMGGGGMLLMSGILAALLERHTSGQGQVVDAAMVDGAAQLMWMFHGFEAIGGWDASKREANMLDGGAHFYGCYQCADGEWVSLGSIEPQFYALLKQHALLPEEEFGKQHDKHQWPRMREALERVMKSKTRAEWCAIMEGTDVCFAPVLSFKEAPQHPANVARKVYLDVDGLTQPAPAPRLSRTPSRVEHGAHAPGQDTESVLKSLKLDANAISALRAAGIIG